MFIAHSYLVNGSSLFTTTANQLACHYYSQVPTFVDILKVLDADQARVKLAKQFHPMLAKKNYTKGTTWCPTSLPRFFLQYLVWLHDEHLALIKRKPILIWGNYERETSANLEHEIDNIYDRGQESKMSQ